MPVTRSAAKSFLSTPGSSTHLIETEPTKAEVGLSSFLATFDELRDDSPLCGRDVKMLCDATSSALEQVWNDSLETAALLTRRINEGNTTLTNGLMTPSQKWVVVLITFRWWPCSNPTIMVLGLLLSPAVPKMEQFSIWLRRLEDVMRMRPAQLTNEQQVNFLIGRLEGVAREKVEELTGEDRMNYASVVAHLRAFFESPQQRYVARQKLSSCRQESGESCTAFANRVLNLVRTATSGQDVGTQKERVLEEFVARLRGDIRYFVKLENPTSLEQAIAKTQTVKQLLNEATAERLLHPSSQHAPVQVTSTLDNVCNTRSQGFPRRGPSRPAQPAVPRQQGQWRTPTAIRTLPGPNFNCHGSGHFSAVCPSPRMQPTQQRGFREPPPVNLRKRGGLTRQLPNANALAWGALRVTQTVCSFPLTQVEREDLLLASARTYVSCAMRFSHTAISVQAQRLLTAEIRRFLPAHPNEAIMPLRVSLLPQEDRNWVDERLAAFTSYGRHIRVARLRMGKLFAVASASLVANMGNSC